MLAHFTINGQVRPLPTDDGVEYRAVEGYSRYLVGSDGSVWSYSWGSWDLDKPRRLRGHIKEKGYIRVGLSGSDGKITNIYIHKLVLNAFVGPRPEDWECRHLNGDPADNRLENLKWGTRLENAADTRKHGKQIARSPKGKDHANSKLTDEDVIAIRNMASSGMTYAKIAEIFGITTTNASFIARGMTWKHVKSGELSSKKDFQSLGAKLSHEDVSRVRQMSRDGMNNTDIARLFSVGKNCIGDIINGKTWKNIP